MQDIRKSPEYQKWRREVRQRDNNTCRICRVQRNLHVHHIKPLEKYPEFSTDLDNGLTLCGNCHALLSGREENTNLQTIIEAFTGQQDTQTAEQLKRLSNKFCNHLETLLKSADQDTVNNAAYKMFAHLQTYPDSLNQFLQLIAYILDNEAGFEDGFAKEIAIQFLKSHTGKAASQMLIENCPQEPSKAASQVLRANYPTQETPKNPASEAQVLIENWNLLSFQCRDRANWKCEECGIDLNLEPKFLHAHHLRGTQYNQPEDLRALCIGCHATQRNHGHMKDLPDYKDFMAKYSKVWQKLIGKS